MKTSSTFTLGILIACAIAIPWLIFCPFSPPWRFLIPVALCLVYLLVRSKKFALNHGDGGFSLIELLVVMAIIAILSAMLVPAALKARKQADINKAKAEMSSFASLESMIYLDVGGYVDLNDLDNTTDPPGATNDIVTFDYTDPDDMANSGKDFEDGEWQGPYATFQPEDLDKGASVAGDFSVHDIPPNHSNTEQDPSNDSDDGENGYPLDPWGMRYLLAYSTTEEVMVIYSCGPDKTLDTTLGDTTASNDDLIYKFK